jgi:molecular chaperone GrpE (heat shock protein)
MKKTNIIALALCAACFLSSCAYSGVTDETTTDSDIVSSEITSESTQKETVTEKTSQTTSKTTTNATTTKSTVTEEVTTKAEEKEELAYILNINSMKFRNLYQKLQKCIKKVKHYATAVLKFYISQIASSFLSVLQMMNELLCL